MLKNLGYAGTYHDKNIAVNMLMENPLDCGLESSALVFSVNLGSKKGDIPKLNDFTFYFMDEANRLYNTHSTSNPNLIIKTDTDDDEPARRPDGLIHADFRHEFLFQELRIAFYYQPYKKIEIIELRH